MGVAGKSSLIEKFMKYKDPEEYEKNYTYISTLNIDGQDWELEILDTPNEEDYQNMLDMWISFGDGFLCFFDIRKRIF